MLFGKNNFSEILLAMLGLVTGDVGRFRDCYPSDDGSEIIVYTRNGGGNREAYQEVFDRLRLHPNYIGDADDDYDCTYATIRFSVPDKFKEAVRQIADKTDTPSTSIDSSPSYDSSPSVDSSTSDNSGAC